MSRRKPLIPVSNPLPLEADGALAREAGAARAQRPAATATSDSEVGEAALYAPVKRFLEARGYRVKGEVEGCDIVARQGEAAPVIIELKRRLSLALLLQGIDRLSLSERVYLAVPRPPPCFRGIAPEAPAVRRLCRRLGLGLIVVGRETVVVVEEPVPYRPRPATARAARLVGEFERRIGDPNVGGRARAPLVTAYRQDALRVAGVLAANGPMRLGDLRRATGIARAAGILQRNVYGWFGRLGRGTYALSAAGQAALGQFAEALAALSAAGG
ncbi:MAG TPA: DUF2161 family putative PD-(D/E)XK-type phosphodiesterase [Stellaceae bacterium]|nr:DUF2161 family putative PD-(D/E)XK-type phosphodiesterase [Stellaceae bacterium]